MKITNSLMLILCLVSLTVTNLQSLHAQNRNTGAGNNSGGTGGGLNTGGLGNSGNGLSNPAINTQLGNLSSSFEGNTGVTGTGDNQGRFVGDQNFSQQTQPRNTNRASNLRSLITPGQSGNSGIQATQTESLLFQPRLQLGFKANPLTITSIQPAISSRFSKFKQFSGVKFALDSAHTLTLTGVVEDNAQRELVEAYFLLEPGVSKIVNKLEVLPSQNLNLNAPAR